MEDWQTIVLWILMVLYALSILTALYNVSKGTYEEKRTPLDNTTKAMMSLLFMLFFSTLVL